MVCLMCSAGCGQLPAQRRLLGQGAWRCSVWMDASCMPLSPSQYAVRPRTRASPAGLNYIYAPAAPALRPARHLAQRQPPPGAHRAPAEQTPAGAGRGPAEGQKQRNQLHRFLFNTISARQASRGRDDTTAAGYRRYAHRSSASHRGGPGLWISTPCRCSHSEPPQLSLRTLPASATSSW